MYTSSPVSRDPSVFIKQSQGHDSFSSFYPFFFLSIFACLHCKFVSRVFIGIIGTIILELGIHMNELWYNVIENQAHCSYSSLYLSIFLSLINSCHIFLRYK